MAGYGRFLQCRMLYYPAGISATEILLPYGAARFASVAAELTGSHFQTIVAGPTG